MRNIEFYSLSAQVLPALAIALVLQRWATFVGHGLSHLTNGRKRMVFRSVSLAAFLGVFGVGEVFCMLVVYFGTEGRLPLFAGPIVWTTLAVLLLAMFVSAFTRVTVEGPGNQVS
ncbi:hypothetical protein ABZ356_30315 [Micromonospora zamorensis]|uniref:hypothetical protein n=1 Tax=Micromonospora zamorensis TaxID=709883 RepID=UPI0033B9760B